LAFSVACGLLIGCKSAPARLEDYLRDDRFAEARALLEEEEVGASPATDAKAEDVELRTRFTGAIEERTQESVESLIASGKPRDAHQLAVSRLENCPWSAELQKVLARSQSLLDAIAATESKWSSLGPSSDPREAWNFLGELEPSRPWIMDSEVLRSLEKYADRAIVAGWERALSNAKGRLTKQERLRLFQELRRRTHPEAHLGRLEQALDLLEPLPRDAAPEAGLDTSALGALASARSVLANDDVMDSAGNLNACVQIVWRSQSTWLDSVLPKYLTSRTVTAQEIAEAEAWLARESAPRTLRPAVARAHVQRAAQVAPLGLASAIALFHLDRAVALGMDDDDEEFRQARFTAQATQAATPAPKCRLDIVLEPAIEPEIRDLVLSWLALRLASRDDALASLDPLSTDPEAPRVTVWASSAKLVCDTSEVTPVQSRYFSHFQDVPNPAKTDLERRCNAAEFNVSMARSSYNSAVSSHNIWPTEYSLNNVNMAYNRYSMAVTTYNFLASSYNATPSTITESVYLPYTFEQGFVSFGWTLGVRVQVNGEAPVDIRRESVARDYVRMGSSGMDEIPTYRSQDPIDIDVSPKAGLEHLALTIEQIQQEMAPMLTQLAGEPIAALATEESRLLGWMYHPWGMQPGLTERLGLPGWMRETARQFQLTRARPQPEARPLPACAEPIAGPLDTESASQLLGPLVCQTISGDGSGSVSTGSGVLIGPEGLVLTCAHVLDGPTLELDFPTGPYKGRRSGSIVFVNRTRDVALVRADDLRNERWAGVRLDEAPRQGEQIVAIGNPTLGGGSTNIGGISAGIVSSPSVERFAGTYLSADITIASGSSGGPLFSLSDGAVIGVIQSVATSPGFKDDMAASGYICLAASSERLREWLGLTTAR
jgi:S1-C subfamily serine protease